MEPTNFTLPQPPSLSEISNTEEVKSQFDKFASVAQKAIEASRRTAETQGITTKVALYKTVKDFIDTNFDYFAMENLKKISGEAFQDMNLVSECAMAAKEHILKSIRVDIDNLLAQYPDPPRSFEYTNYLKQRLRNYMDGAISYEGSQDNYFAVSELLKNYSIEDLQRTGLDPHDLLKLQENNPALLDKLVTVGFPFKVAPPPEIEPVLDLALDMPESTRPMVHEMLRNIADIYETSYEESAAYIKEIKPLIDYFRANLNSHKDPEKFISRFEKLMGLGLFQRDFFVKNIVPVIREAKFDQLLECADKIQHLENLQEIDKAIEAIVPKKEVDWKAALMQRLNAMPEHKDALEKWVMNLVKWGMPANAAVPANLEKWLQETDKKPGWFDAYMFTCEKLSSMDGGVIREMIPVLLKLPHRAGELIAFFQKASPEGKVNLTRLVDTDIGSATFLIIKAGTSQEIEDCMRLGARLSEVFGEVKGKEILNKLLKSNLSMYNINRLNHLSTEELLFYEPEYGRNNSFILNSDYYEVIKKTPGGPQLYHNFICKIQDWEIDGICGLISDKPESVATFAKFKSLKTLGLFLHALAGYSSNKKIFKDLVDAGFPIEFIEQIGENVANEYDPTAQALHDYLMQYKDSANKEDAIRIAKQILDFSHLSDIAGVRKVLDSVMDPGKEPYAKAALALIEKGKYEAVPKIWEMGAEKLSDFVEGVLKSDTARKNLPLPKGNFAFSNSVGGESINLKAAIEMADFLILEDGTIDPGRAAAISASGALERPGLSEHAKGNFLFKVETLSRDPYFSERLTQIKEVPKQGTAMYSLLQKVLGKDEITLRDVRVALLSGLLWPMRQGYIGSCFSTSIVIQSEYSPAGLRQSFEDLVSILQDSKMTRTAFNQEANAYMTQDYPAFVKDLISEESFQHDHLLSRAREFTIASLSAREMDDKPVEPLIKAIGKISPELEKDLREVFESEAKKMLKDVFLPAKKNPATGEIGAWCWYNPAKNELLDSKEKYVAFLNELMDRVETIFSKQNPEKRAKISKVFEGPGRLRAFVNSPAALFDFKENLSFLERMNPMRYAEVGVGPWARYGAGGDPNKLLEKYLEKPNSDRLTYKRTLSALNNHEKLKILLDSIIQLPKPLKQLSGDNPHFKVPIASSTNVEGHGGHAYSLEPHVVLELAKTKSSDEIIADLMQQAQDLKTQVLDASQVAVILDNMKKISPYCFNTYIRALSDPILLTATSVQELWDLIYKRGLDLGYRVANLPKIDAIFAASLAQTEFKDKVPMLRLGDTNWEGRTDVKCFYSFYKNEMALGFFGKTEPVPLELDNLELDPKMVYHNEFNLVKAN